MARLTTLALYLTICLLGHSTAHFTLSYPPTIGFDEDLEGKAPCGGFTADFSKPGLTDFHIGGDFIALASTHPAATWLFRATLDQTAAGNWTNLLPAVQQSGLGNFCESGLKLPEAWAGSKGVVSIVQTATDGLLYQCSAVNFVTGENTPSGVCKNMTGLSAAYTTDAKLSSIPATAAATSSSGAATSSSSSAGTGPTGSNTAQASQAAQTLDSYGGLGMLVALVVIGSVSFAAKLM